MKRMQVMLAIVFAVVCICFGSSFAFADNENPSAANANEASCETDAIVGTVKIDGRPLHAGEFDFGVKYANGREDLLSAKNKEDGTIDFGKLSYTASSLEELTQNGIAEKSVEGGTTTWTVYYLAYEKTSGLDDVGVTPRTAPVSLIVTAKESEDGVLSAGFRTTSNLYFDNAYSTGEPVNVFLAGTKNLQVEAGASPVDIEGRFRFDITTKDTAAPMPESTVAGNGRWGRIEFGFIAFSLEDLNKALEADANSAESKGWSRSYVFKYKITEKGTVPGVVNDPESKTVSFKVTDNGKGELAVACLESDSPSTAFTFTNRSVVLPDNSADFDGDSDLGRGEEDELSASNGSSSAGIGIVDSYSVANGASKVSSGAAASLTPKTGDAALALAAVLVAAAGLAIAIAVFARGRGTSRKK